jgi:predicted ATPase
MHRLDQIQVAGFKSIRDQTLDLRTLNVLIGANGAGKSNFIEAFRLLNEIVNQNLQLFVAQSGGADRLLHFGRKVTEEIFVQLQFDHSAYRCKLVPVTGDSLVFKEERVRSLRTDPDHIYDASLGVGHRETFLFEECGQGGNASIVDQVVMALQNWKVYHFQDTSVSAKVKQVSDLTDNVALRSDAGNLAAFLYRLQETDSGAFRNIVDTIRLVAPFFGGFDLRPDRLNPDTIKLEWREKGTDTYFDANSLSDGTLRFMCLATLLLQPQPPTTILIDEPELGLHPYAIAVLADLFRSAAESTQVVVSTQSVTLVNQLSPEDIVVIDREGSESVLRRPSSTDLANWLDGYALGELWEKNVLGGRPRS